MRIRFFICAIALILVCCIVVIFCNSDYYYSQKLLNAVKIQDIVLVDQIISKKPSCINTVPTLMPQWVYLLIDSPRPTYALYEACTTGNLELIQLLIDAGADVNGKEYAIPLSVVYRNKQDNWYEISQLLLENGASLNYTTKYSGGYLSVLCDILQEKPGANTDGYVPENVNEVVIAFDYAIKNCDHTQVNWMRVLQYSVSYDRIEIVESLLDKGYCEVNDASTGMTALMFAARDSTPEMVELLLRYGADKSKQTEDGKTAYDYAVEYNRQEIISILKD